MYSTFFFAFGTFELLKKGSIFVLHFSEYKYVRTCENSVLEDFKLHTVLHECAVVNEHF